MYKHISKLTEKDKAKILASYRNRAIRSYGMEWDEWATQIIQKEIDQIFDANTVEDLTQRSKQLSSVQYTKTSKLTSKLTAKLRKPESFLTRNPNRLSS